MARNPVSLTLNLLDRLARMTATDSHSEGLKPAQWETLRYLDRANRFSCTPGALTAYLQVTKGTVSQTVRSLEQRKLLEKKTGRSDRRTVRLSLTARGRKQLEHDPLLRMEIALERLPGETRQHLADGLQALLDVRLEQDGGPRFGQCRQCRHLRRRTAAESPWRCLLLDQALTPGDTKRICVKFEPGNR